MYIVRKKYIPPETRSPLNRSFSSLLISNRVVYLRYNYKRVKNPLFLQPNRSFDFGTNFFISILFLLHICLQSIIWNS
ncbi:hypothetical protein M6B38_315155 [Iris pallida]|uniref:Uncharacterized protein n=1 Tax=Iris pallida TaxID=29817 RepID=A0AAX6HEQ2_IRIPA|nr:hypothetical protein M6B38_315155 [Iris pallida]